jgi:MFS transporter, DHA2 family, multidrug resistance protein
VTGKPWYTVAVLCVCVLILNLDITIINVALGTLSESLGASTRDLQWITAVYMLAASAFIVITGIVADRFGRRLLLLSGLTVFALSSAMAAWAPTPGVLIAGRALMGLGSAAILTGSVSIITTMFHGSTMRRALAAWSTAAALGLPLGPVIGGYLLDTFWWGSIFLINIFICAAALVCVWFLVPETRGKTATKVDFPSIGLMSLASLLLTYALVGMEGGRIETEAVVVLIVSVVLFALFLFRQRRVHHPLLDLAVVSRLSFVAPMLTLVVIFFSMAGVLFVVPVYLQYAQHLDVFSAGLRIVPLAAGVAVASLANERILKITTPETLMSGGLVALAGGLFLLMGMDPDVSVLWMSAAMVLTGLGIGLAQPSALGQSIRSFPVERHGVASGVVNSIRLTAGSLGVAVTGTVVAALWTRGIARAGDSAAAASIDRNNLITEAGMACGAADRNGAAQLVCGPYTDSVGVVFAACGVLALVAVLLMAISRRVSGTAAR